MLCQGRSVQRLYTTEISVIFQMMEHTFFLISDGDIIFKKSIIKEIIMGFKSS